MNIDDTQPTENVAIPPQNLPIINRNSKRRKVPDGSKAGDAASRLSNTQSPIELNITSKAPSEKAESIVPKEIINLKKLQSRIESTKQLDRGMTPSSIQNSTTAHYTTTNTLLNDEQLNTMKSGQ